jgi:hypothetical protein
METFLEQLFLGELGHAANGVAEFGAFQCDGLVVVSRQDGLVVRELAG